MKLIKFIIILNILVPGEILATNSEIVLTKENHAVLTTEVNGSSVAITIDKLRELDSSKTRYLYINSPGGEVDTGLRLISYLQSSEGKGIVCIADTAISMAFVALQACETRLVTPNAMLMSHRVAGGTKGYAKRIESDLKLMKGLDLLLATIQATRMGISIEELTKRQNDEYWIVGGSEVVKANAADKVSKVVCNKELAKPFEVNDIDGQGLPIKVKKSLCPL